MKTKANAPRGTFDILPKEVYKWQFVEKTFKKITEMFCFKEIRTPVFEYTELFLRGIGENTDIVNKEMYTFKDKGDRSITLRPEGTASATRALLQHGLLNEGLPQKLYYLMPCYRYEKPQSGRYREFRQLGAEVFGSKHPSAEAELILLVKIFLDTLGLNQVKIAINSIGCTSCREKYYNELKDYFKNYIAEICPDCVQRLEKNPMRVLDCREEKCKVISQNAPVVLNYLCKECQDHFDLLKDYLTSSNVEFTVDSTIVRGLDYYTKTVFEFTFEDGLAICGGGRYDGLVEELGGAPTAAVGFGIGQERILACMEEVDFNFPQPQNVDVYLASVDQKSNKEAFTLANLLNKNGISAQSDFMQRGLKAQLKYADKIGAKYCIVLGEDEIKTSKANLKHMGDGKIFVVSILKEDFVDQVKSILKTNFNN